MGYRQNGGLIQLSDEDVASALTWPALVEAIERIVTDGSASAPPRISGPLVDTDGTAGNLLVMPARQGSSVVGIKTVAVWPSELQGRPSHGASYVLIDARSAAVIAVLAANELNRRRTAAISVLAAKHLMRRDARSLLVVGSGPVARALVEGHAVMHPFEQIQLYARDTAKADRVVAEARDAGIDCTVATDLAVACGRADAIVAATSARTPVLDGSWIRQGTHVGLIGSFTPAMREADDELMRRADAVWMDTSVAMAESGDLIDPLVSGALVEEKVRGTLQELVATAPARDPQHITVFKSVGFALADLAAAQAVLSVRDNDAVASAAAAPSSR